MERSLYNQKGSVDDTRCSLQFVNPGTRQEALNEMDLLTASIDNEMKNQNRTSVIKMLESKKSWVKRMIETKLND